MKRYHGSCHCGRVCFEIETELKELITCNCSICTKKNALMASVPEENFRLIKGEEHLAVYQFNKMIAKHYFCKTCGIHPFHRSRSRPVFYGINVNCLDDLKENERKALPIRQVDGRSFD